MPDPDKPIPVPKVSCEVCRKQIPRSAAHTAEGRDYTYYFCGPHCHQQWPQQSRERPPLRGPS